MDKFYYLLIEKEKKLDFFDWMRELDKKSREFWEELPINKWIAFNTVPGDILHLIFQRIERDSQVSVDSNYTQFKKCY